MNDDSVFPHIQKNQLESIPVSSVILESHTSLFGKMLSFSNDKVINLTNDAYIFNLYFPDHMKERGIDVLEFVERDINEVMQGREFEKLGDTEKEQVIEALHAKWSHPDNEVVKRMAMFKEKSPDILKPILES